MRKDSYVYDFIDRHILEFNSGGQDALIFFLIVFEDYTFFAHTFG